MNAPTPCPPRAAATSLLAASIALVAATFAPAQSVNYTFRNGGNFVGCGALVGGPLIVHQFSTTGPINDPIAVTDPGTATAPSSFANAQFDSSATDAGLSVAVAGTAHRGAPPAVITAVADGRDNWQFTIATPMRFTLNVTLATTSTEATVPPCHFTFAGGLVVPDPGSPAAPYQHTLNAPGSFNLTASGTLMPGGYGLTIFGRTEGTTFPFTGSYAASFTLTLQPAATVATRTAFGNPNSYTCSLPILGQTWNAAVDVGSTGHTFAAVFASLSPAQVPAGPGFTVLLGSPVLEFLPVAAGPLATYALSLPANASLAGAQLFTQALHVGGPPTLVLSNALDLTLGF